MPGGLQGARFLPMPLTSAKAILPPGRRIRRSGIPSKPGLMNLGRHRPLFLPPRRACAPVFSLSHKPPFPLARYAVFSYKSYARM
jgi:hypothetical protein